MLARALPSLPGGGQIQDRAASTDIAGRKGLVISRERPFLGFRRVNDSSTELGLPPHGNSLGLQNPSGYWESIAPAVPEISVPRKNLARSLPGFCPAFFPQALPGPGFTQCHTRAIAPGNNRWRSYNWDFPRASRGVLYSSRPAVVEAGVTEDWVQSFFLKQRPADAAPDDDGNTAMKRVAKQGAPWW